MPILRRQAAPLLSVVGGRERYKSTPTKTSGVEDIDRSPESSDNDAPDEEPDFVEIPNPSAPVASPIKPPPKSSPRTKRKAQHAADKPCPAPSKRRKSEAQQEDDPTLGWMWSQPSSQRGSASQKMYGSAPVRNMFTSKPEPMDKPAKGKRKSKRVSAGFSMPSEPAMDEQAAHNKANFQLPEGDVPSSQVMSSAQLLGDSDDEGKDPSSALTSPPTEPGSDENPAGADDAIKCSMCGQPVDRGFFESYNNGDPLRNWKEKMMFCKSHKLHTAEESWRQRGYPTIDWKHLEKRLARHVGALTRILNGKRQSYYRNELEEKVDSGEIRHALRDVRQASQHTLTPGYYGSKGHKRMMDWLATKFKARVGQLGATDRVVKEAGRMAFIQAVLAPELTIMLIMEDMHCDEEQARVVLSESGELGDLLNAEEDERVQVRDDSDEGGTDGAAAAAPFDATQVVDMTNA